MAITTKGVTAMAAMLAALSTVGQTCVRRVVSVKERWRGGKRRKNGGKRENTKVG